MNGVHDMGGMDGFGKVEVEPNEPMFHTAWEARVLAMVRAMGAAGAFNIDTSRFYREALPPHVYLSSSYYKKWLMMYLNDPQYRIVLHTADSLTGPWSEEQVIVTGKQYPPLVCMLSQRLDDLLVKACLILHWRNSLLLSGAV